MSSYRVFLSSPGDVRTERDHAQAVIERLNTERVDQTPFEIVRWEDSHYTAASDFQSQILDPKQCDLVVCIFWQRLGTELPPSYRRSDGTTPTGTEFEFENAIEGAGKRPDKLPDIFVYRKSGDLRFSSDMSSPSGSLDIHRLEYEQYQRFMAFWQRWFRSEKGQFLAAFGHFASLEEFETLLESNLRSWLRATETVLQWTSGSPFRALEPFDVEHAPIFFGRRREVERVRARLITAALAGSPFLLLTGISGAGKSSLVRAGLLPRLNKAGGLSELGDRLRRVILSPGSISANWQAGIASALFSSDALGEELRAGDFARVDDLARQFNHTDGAALPLNSALIRAGKTLAAEENSEKPQKFMLLIVIDQLEQMFSWKRSEADSFLNFLKALCAMPASPFLVVATLRSDFIHRLSEFETLIELCGRSDSLGPGQAERTLELMLPGPADLREMITGPARAAGLDFEASASDDRDLARIIEEQAAPQLMPAIELLLSELYQRRNGKLLELATFDALKGVAGVMAARGEEILKQVSKLARASFPRVMHALVSQSGNDVPATARRAAANAFARDSAAEELVGELKKARLVLADETHQWFAHDSILAGWTRLREFVATERSFFDARERLEQLCNRWVRAGPGAEKNRLLLEGFQLDEGRELLSRWGAEALRDKEPDLPAFITTSQRRYKIKQRSRAFAVLGGATVVLAALSLYFVQSRSAALARQVLASIQDAEKSRVLLGDGHIYDAVNSATLSYQAYRLAQSRSVLADTILRVSPHVTARYALPGNSNQTLVWTDETTIGVATDSTAPPGDFTIASAKKTPPKILSFVASADAGATSVREQELPLREGIAVARYLRRLGSGATVAVMADGYVTTVGSQPSAGQGQSGNAGVVGNSPSSVSVSQSGKVVAIVGSTDDLSLIECAGPDTGNYEACPNRKLTGIRATAVSINPDEAKLAIATRDGDILIYDRNRKEFDDPVKTAGEVTALAWANTGDLLAFATADGHMSVIDRSLPASAPLRTEVCAGRISVVSWSPTSPDLGFDCDGKLLYLWKLAQDGGLAEREPPEILDAYLDGLSRLAWSPSGVRLASLDANSVVETFDLAQTRSGFSTLYAGNPVSALVQSADGESFAAGESDGSISLWRLRDKSFVRRIKLPAKTPVAFLAAGAPGEFAASHADGNLSVASAAGVASFGPATPAGAPVAFVQHDELVAAAHTESHVIKMFSVSAGGETKPAISPNGDVSPYGVVAGKSGNRLFASYDDGSIIEWDFGDKAGSYSFSDDLPRDNDRQAARGLAVSASDRWLARTGGDNYVRLYDIARRKAVKALPTGDSAPTAVSFSPDGTRLAVLSGKLFIWDVVADPPELTVTIDIGSLVPGINLNQISTQGLIWLTNSDLALASGDARISLLALDFDRWLGRAKQVTLQKLGH